MQKHGPSAWLLLAKRQQGVELNMTHSLCVIKGPSKLKLGHFMSQNRWRQINKFKSFFSCHPNHSSVSSQTCSSDARGAFLSFRILSRFALLDKRPHTLRERMEAGQLQDTCCMGRSDCPEERALHPSDKPTRDWLDTSAWNKEVHQENEQLARSRLLA